MYVHTYNYAVCQTSNILLEVRGPFTNYYPCHRTQKIETSSPKDDYISYINCKCQYLCGKEKCLVLSLPFPHLQRLRNRFPKDVLLMLSQL